MRSFRWVAIGALLAVALVSAFLAARPASAIPAWSRAYGTDCGTCHVAGFRLTRAGQDFLRAGHTMGAPRKDMSLNQHVSVAQKSRFNYSHTENKNGTNASTTNTFEQHALSLYMGGPLQNDFSYFAELYWHENSGNTSGASDQNDYGRSKLADAYLQYLNRQNDERYTSVRFGQFSPYLLHLHGVGARLTGDRPYVINSGTVGSNPYKPFQRQYGVEVAHYINGVYASAALMNGTGGKLYNRVDNDLKKDVVGTLDYTFNENGSMLGVYGYAGHYPIGLASEDSAHYVLGSYDNFNQVGLIGNYTITQGALVGAFFQGENKFVPRPSGTETTQRSKGYYLEAQVYSLHPRFQPFLRYDFWDVNTAAAKNDVSGLTAGFSWRALENGRIVSHYQRLTTKNAIRGNERVENRIVSEVSFMF